MSEEERTFLAAERNNFAAERTFLSWIRTGLAGLVGSVAMIRVLTFTSPSHQMIAHTIGYLLLIWATGLFYIALCEYETATKVLKEAYPQLRIPLGRRRGVVAVLFVVVVLLLVLFLT